MTDTRTPPGDPCPSCPYRRDCPSGVWTASEYDRLSRYDGEIAAQVRAEAWGTFGCHQGDGTLCRGWLGHRDPYDLLALKVAVLREQVPPEVFHYATTVPLFATGEEAAEHGRRDIAAPGDKARAAGQKIVRVRRARGVEVDLG